MSYISRCVNKKDFMLKTLKPSSNLILFVFSENLFYIGMTVSDMVEVMKQGQNHYFKKNENETNFKLETFYLIQNGIYIDSSLKNCFESKNNTMKLIKSGKFKKGFEKTEEWFDFFSVTEIERKSICETEKSFFEIEVITNDTNTSDSEDGNEIDWTEVKKQNEIRTKKLENQKENERKITGNYTEETFFDSNIKTENL